MAPDLNSLPPSGSSSSPTPIPSRNMSTPTEAGAALRGQTPSPLSRTTSISLQAAAAVNAGLQLSDSRRSSSSSITRTRQPSHAGRRRSAVLANLQLNDPCMPSPGEMVTEHAAVSTPHSLAGSPIISTGDPHHLRHPSLGEIHQELEQEQEAQVNRLLQMIRIQQQQLQQLQSAGGAQANANAIDDTPVTSELSLPQPHSNLSQGNTSSAAAPRSPTAVLHPRSSFDLARADLHRRSRTPSRTASPHLRATSISNDIGEGAILSGRDESAFYQAETQMLNRENQMLRMRIRELERQVYDLHSSTPIPHEPVTHTNLMRTQSAMEDDSAITAHTVRSTTA